MLTKTFIDAVRLSDIRQYELAAQAGMDPSHLSQMIHGQIKAKEGDPRINRIGEILGLKEEEIFLDDPYLLPLWMVKNRDMWRGGRALFARIRETSFKTRQRAFNRDPSFLLCQGAAVGICEDNVVRHIWPKYYKNAGQSFLGFALLNFERDRIEVITRGSYVLSVQGAKPEGYGKSVYCIEPNTFTVDKDSGGLEIGKIRFVQGHRSTVAFKAYNDPDPLNLKY